jgi:hypothetical protein
MKGGQALLGLGIVVGLFGCGREVVAAGRAALSGQHRLREPIELHLRPVPRHLPRRPRLSRGQRCVAAPGGAVCQPEGKCNYLSECPRPLVCALDRQCRSECKRSIDCATKTQTCVSGVCAEPQEVDSTGKLKNAEATAVPTRPMAACWTWAWCRRRPTGLPPPTRLLRRRVRTGRCTGPDLAPLPPDLNLGDIPVGPCGFQDPYEPTNDKRETAIQLAPGVPVQGCVAARIPPSTPTGSRWSRPTIPRGATSRWPSPTSGPDKVGVTTYAASDNTIILDWLMRPRSGRFGQRLLRRGARQALPAGLLRQLRLPLQACRSATPSGPATPR